MLISKIKTILFYFQGIVNVILLSIIVYSFFGIKKIKEQRGCFKINFPDTLQLKKEGFYTLYNGNIFPYRKFTDLNLTGNIKADKIKLQFFHRRVSEMINSNDTTSGMHLIFGDSTNYGDFIRAVDILRSEKARLYLVVDNHLWYIRSAKEGPR